MELYVNNQYHHQAAVKYAAPQGDALLVDIQATRARYSLLVAHALHMSGGTAMAYSTWWARLLSQVGLHVDLRVTLILADTNSEATAAGGRHGARRTDWQRVCQEHGLKDLAQMR